MEETSDNSVGVDRSVLDRAGDQIAAGLEAGEVVEERRIFVEGLERLQAGDVTEATRAFRRAARQSPAPINYLARVARGECERLQGRDGLAIRQWQRVADDADAPAATRYMAWLSLAAAAQSRGDDQLLERAERAITQFESSEAV